MKIPFYSLTYSELCNRLSGENLPLEGARQMFNWFYKKGKSNPCLLHNFSRKNLTFANDQLSFELPAVVETQQSDDKTVKFLFRFVDNRQVEAVLIPFQNKYTVCLSSQVGCSMKCSFCYTGAQGFTRHLKADEIVGQFVQIQNWLSHHRPCDDRILNIVFMGQGEPLHNFDAVRSACDIFLSQHGLSIGFHKITVSTAGYLPGLLRWKSEMPNVNIALSLHSVIAEKRNQLIPLNKSFPLEQLLPLLDQIPQEKKRFVTYEYLVLDGYNDSDEEVHKVGELLKNRRAFVNLIPFNPYPGSLYGRPSEQTLIRLQHILEGYKIPVTVRTTKGERVLAACGQLNTAQ